MTKNATAAILVQFMFAKAQSFRRILGHRSKDIDNRFRQRICEAKGYEVDSAFGAPMRKSTVPDANLLTSRIDKSAWQHSGEFILFFGGRVARATRSPRTQLRGESPAFQIRDPVIICIREQRGA